MMARRTALFLALQLALGTCWAQDQQRGVATVEAGPDAEPAAAPTVEFDRTPVLPVMPVEPTSDQLAQVPEVFVRRIRLEGRSVLSDEAFTAAVAPYEGRVVTMEELNELRTGLSLLYFDQGYVNSGVILPDQKVTQGEIVFVEVLGSLDRVELQGNRHLGDEWWAERIIDLKSKKLNINKLQDKLRVIEQEPLVRRIEAQLMPGEAAGDGVLRLSIHETSPWRVVLGADNHRSPSLGGEQLTLYLAHLSLTGRGDQAEVYANLADGLGDFGLAYTLPVGSGGASLRGYFSAGDAEIVEQPFDLVNIETQTATLGAEFSWPFRRSSTSALVGLLGVETQRSENTLLGMPWSFSLGEIEGEAEAATAFGGFEWTRRGVDQVFALRMTLRQGTDWFGTDVNAFAPEGLNAPGHDYLSLRGQLQFIRRMDWFDSELLLRSAFQFAKDPLLPVEKMPVGGFTSVRGYRENLLVRDNGLTLSAEWRVPLFTGRQPAEGIDWRALTLAAFTDFGQSWDQDTGLPSDRKQRIYSIGAGAFWQPLPSLEAYVYYGEALNDLEAAGDDLQDDGWHFRISYRVF